MTNESKAKISPSAAGRAITMPLLSASKRRKLVALYEGVPFSGQLRKTYTSPEGKLLCERIAALRDLGFTKLQLADALDVSAQSIYFMARNGRHAAVGPHAYMGVRRELDKLAQIAKKPAATLFDLMPESDLEVEIRIRRTGVEVSLRRNPTR